MLRLLSATWTLAGSTTLAVAGGTAAELLQRFDRREAGGFLDVHNADVGAVTGQRERDALADAAGAAGDDNDFVSKSRIGHSSVSPIHGPEMLRAL